MYRQRWGVEDSFKFLKPCLGWKEVQLLDWQALRTLVALDWVADGFLYGLCISKKWAQVQLLAKLGGWEPYKGRQPGKFTLQLGLSRLLGILVTQALLTAYETTYYGLPPQIAAFIHHRGPPHQFWVDLRVGEKMDLSTIVWGDIPSKFLCTKSQYLPLVSRNTSML